MQGDATKVPKEAETKRDCVITFSIILTRKFWMLSNAATNQPQSNPRGLSGSPEKKSSNHLKTIEHRAADITSIEKLLEIRKSNE